MKRILLTNLAHQAIRLSIAAVALTLPLLADTPVANVQPLANENQAKVLRTAELIRKSIVTLPNYGVFDDISFSIKGSEVTLNGFASRPTLRQTRHALSKRSKESIR